MKKSLLCALAMSLTLSAASTQAADCSTPQKANKVYQGCLWTCALYIPAFLVKTLVNCAEDCKIRKCQQG